ncbi:MAG: hypothetical protein GWP63_05945 [Haliea sp.]|jgi:hypothetical protein|nr:hypothetical protein [Haliea sp.]
MKNFHGYDWDSGSDIVIDPSQPDASNSSFEYFDFGDGKSHRVRLEDIRQHRFGLALRVADNDSGEERILELLA